MTVKLGRDDGHRGDADVGVLCGNERSENDCFRMGAAIAVGELYDMAAFGIFLEDEAQVKSYLASFGIRGLDDIDDLGIKGPYRRDFERLYRVKPSK